MALVDLEGLQNLKEWSVIISQLDQKQDSFSKEDFFIVDKQKYDSYSTRKIGYDDLSSNIFDTIASINANMSGEWEFSKGNRIYFDTVGHLNSEDKTIAVNLDYLHNNLIQSIYDLSAKLYSDESIIPSYVGQIITSSTLSTSYEVKKRYGMDTSWESIQGRFIMGCGTPDKNDYVKFGELGKNPSEYSVDSSSGESKVVLTSDNIPQHTHRFKANSSSFTIKWYLSWINEPLTGSHSAGVQFYSSGQIVTTKNKGTRLRDGVFWAKAKPLETMDATFTGEGTISTTDFNCKGNLMPNVFDPDASPGSNPISSNCFHNNMPPFRTEYIWRRLS